MQKQCRVVHLLSQGLVAQVGCVPRFPQRWRPHKQPEESGMPCQSLPASQQARTGEALEDLPEAGGTQEGAADREKHLGYSPLP